MKAAVLDCVNSNTELDGKPTVACSALNIPLIIMIIIIIIMMIINTDNTPDPVIVQA